MRRFTTLVLFLSLTVSTWAQSKNHTLEFDGETFRPQVYEINGQVYYSADDQEVLSLLSQSNVTAQWSSSGNTMFVFAPGRESYWTAGSDKAKINGKEQPAPGLVRIEQGKRYIQPQALFYAAAIKGVEKAQGYSLFPVITEVAKADSGFLLRSASKARAKADVTETATDVTLNGFAWDGAPKFLLDDTQFEIRGGADKGQSLVVHVTPKAFQVVKLAGSTLLNETRLELQPNFPGAEMSREVALTSLRSESSEGLPMLVFDFDAGTKLHYLQDEKEKVVRIFVPKAEYEGSEFRSSDWPGVKVSTVQTSLYPVLEITVPIQENLEFVQIEDAPTTMALMRGPKGKVEGLASSGSVETPGWMNVRGTIVIDPGHGGSDPGCVNRSIGTREADVTLKIALNLAEILRSQGWTVKLTRESDRDVTYAGSPDMMELEARADVANNMGADLFVSIHCNASVGAGANGSSIHWWKTEDYEFAQSLEYVLGPTIGLGHKGLIRDRFVVLRHSKMPSVLIETAFLTNPSEGAKLSDPEFQKVIARQIAGGLASYMQGRYASRGQRPIE